MVRGAWLTVVHGVAELDMTELLKTIIECIPTDGLSVQSLQHQKPIIQHWSQPTCSWLSVDNYSPQKPCNSVRNVEECTISWVLDIRDSQELSVSTVIFSASKVGMVTPWDTQISKAMKSWEKTHKLPSLTYLTYYLKFKEGVLIHSQLHTEYIFLLNFL